MRRAALAALLVACASSTPPRHTITNVGTARELAAGPAGDASMFHRDRFADAGAVVDEPVACDGATFRIVVHGRGRHHLAHRLPPECGGVSANACDYVDENVFWKDLSSRWGHAIGGTDCGDRPRVGGLVGFDAGWIGADAAVSLIVDTLSKWDVDADIAYYVAPPLPEPHLL